MDERSSSSLLWKCSLLDGGHLAWVGMVHLWWHWFKNANWGTVDWNLVSIFLRVHSLVLVNQIVWDTVTIRQMRSGKNLFLIQNWGFVWKLLLAWTRIDWVNSRLVNRISFSLFESDLYCSLFVFIMNHLVVLSSWVDGLNVGVLRHLRRVIARLLLKSSMRFVHMLNTIQLGWRSSWNLSHLLRGFRNSRIYSVMVAVLCWYFRVFKLVSWLFLCIIERSVSLLTLSSTAHSFISWSSLWTSVCILRLRKLAF